MLIHNLPLSLDTEPVRFGQSLPNQVRPNRTEVRLFTTLNQTSSYFSPTNTFWQIGVQFIKKSKQTENKFVIELCRPA